MPPLSHLISAGGREQVIMSVNSPKRETDLSTPSRPLPLRVGSALEADFVRATVHVIDARLGLVYTLYGVLHDDFPARVIGGHGIHGNVAQIAFGHQVL